VVDVCAAFVSQSGELALPLLSLRAANSFCSFVRSFVRSFVSCASAFVRVRRGVRVVGAHRFVWLLSLVVCCFFFWIVD
jgi:hypothetical protein